MLAKVGYCINLLKNSTVINNKKTQRKYKDINIWRTINKETKVIKMPKINEPYRNFEKVWSKTKDLKIEAIKARAQAEKANALKSAFLENMSHEVRTPLNAILGLIDLIDLPEISDQDRSKYKKLIHANGQALLSLMNDIIDISKIESGVLEVMSETFELNEVFNNVYQSFQTKHMEMGCDFKFEFEHTDLLFIKSDRNRVQQILFNLLDNAFKFTTEGIVLFGFTHTETKVECYVEDTGVGIASENLNIIFDRFTTLNNKNDAVYRGIGLGLAIVKHLAEILNGKVKVKSIPGKGSKFSVTLPINN